MIYAVVDATKCTVETLDADFEPALKAAGLDATDHGLIIRPGHDQIAPHGIGLFVEEFSMYVPPYMQRYFRIGSHLYAGNALLYAFDEAGETVDIVSIPCIHWLPTEVSVWEAILNCEIVHPTASVNGEEYWRWPQPMPGLNAIVGKMP